MDHIDEPRTLQILKSILDINQKLTGIDYLKEFIKNIAINLNVKYALIGHPVDKFLNHVQTDVVWANGDYFENFQYQLKGTPCEHVISGERVCIHEKNVCVDFPEDKLLQEMGVEAYIGAPVISKSPSGLSSILVLLDDKPIKNKDFFIAITEFLALRASAEIEKCHIEENLIQQVKQRTLQLEKATKKIKKNQKKIELINNNLEIRVKEEVNKNQLNQKLISYQSKMAAMGEMIENIAHQWRQPLSVISTNATGVNLRVDFQTLDDKNLKESMDDIMNSVKHLSQTIDDFRNYFKTERIKTEFMLKDTFEKTFKLILSQFKNQDITIVENIDEITIYGFENELIQVLINILNNARDELIKKENQEKLICINVLKNNTNVEITIRDNAGGIAENIINEIFESHFTTKLDLNGTGIGLYMSKLIITEHMDGTIDANNISFIHENISYHGAEFKIYLPI